MFGLQSFYKKINPCFKSDFLVELFYVGRFSPTRYSIWWLSIAAFCLLWFGSSWFLFVLFVVFVWYFLYFILFISFLYKWKKKHLNSRKN